MSQLVKTERQANFKDFKRFGAFRRLVEQKNVEFETANLRTNELNTTFFLLNKLHNII
jgi:hypothetical protein